MKYILPWRIYATTVLKGLILLKLEQSAFIQASFSSLFDIHKCLCDLQMAPSSLGKQTADCESPHDWLMSLPMDLAVFSRDVAFACHFVAPRPPPTLPPYRSASGIDYAKKTIYNMMGNSASYPVYSRQWITLNSYRFVEKYMQAALINPKIHWIEFFKTLLLNIYNSAYKTPFCTSSHIVVIYSY